MTGALERDVFEQLHPHFTGGPGSAGVLLHQHEVGVVAVQGIHCAVRQVLRLVHSGLVRLESMNAGVQSRHRTARATRTREM